MSADLPFSPFPFQSALAKFKGKISYSPELNTLVGNYGEATPEIRLGEKSPLFTQEEWEATCREIAQFLNSQKPVCRCQIDGDGYTNHRDDRNCPKNPDNR